MPETKIVGNVDPGFLHNMPNPNPGYMPPHFAQGLPQAMPQQTSSNPLQQYFRRPALQLSLPSGKNYYTPDVVQYPPTGELPVYPMTAIDEITARTPDSAFNGSAVAEIIQSCIPSIKNAWKIGLHDLDAILTAIKIASVGEKMEVVSVCPECSNEGTFDVDLLGVLSGLNATQFNDVKTLHDLSIKFRPLTYDELNTVSIEQYNLQKTVRNIQELSDTIDDSERAKLTKETLAKLGDLNTNIATAGIEYIKTPQETVYDKNFIHDYLINAPKDDYNNVLKLFAETREACQVQPQHVNCPNCGHRYTQTFSVNPTDFFD